MRAVLGPVLVHGMLLAVGLGMLRAAGVIESLRSPRALAAAGLAYLVGVAGTLGVCVIVLVLGGPFTLEVFAVVAAALLVLGLGWRRGSGLTGRRTAGWVRRPRGTGEWAVAATLTAFGVLAMIGLFTLADRPIGLLDADAWNDWGRKALLLVDGSHLPTAIFGFSGDVRYDAHYNINASYPLLLPLLEALHMRALGRGDPSSVHLVMWLLAIAFVWAGGFIASRVTSPLVWAPVLTGAVLLSWGRLLSGYADIPVSFYLCLATLALGVWLQSWRRSDLAVAALLLAGAVGLKNEGTAGALLLLAAALAVTLLARRRRAALELTVAAGLVVVLAILPWRVWVLVHHPQTEEPLGRIADPVYLLGHLGRLWTALQAFGQQLGIANGVAVFVSVAVAMTLVCFWERRARPLAGFYLAALVGYLVIVVWSVWINTLSVGSLVMHGVPRVVLGACFIAVAVVLHLSGLGTPGSDSPTAAATGSA